MQRPNPALDVLVQLSSDTDPKPKTVAIEKPYFFIDTTEKQFKDVLNSFSCQQKPELIRKRWEVEREKILKVIRVIFQF